MKIPEVTDEELQRGRDSREEWRIRQRLNPNCLSNWYPKLEGIRTPKTIIVRHEGDDLVQLLDDDLIKGDSIKGYQELLVQLGVAGNAIGWPVFLRTGLTSAKHSWKNSCFLKHSTDLPRHIAELVEFSACADFVGLPTDVWVVREFLHLDHSFTAYQGMPVAREWRAFIEDGTVLCVHPYWPEKAVEDGQPSIQEWRQAYVSLVDRDFESEERMALIRHVATRFSGRGAWSVDVCRLHSGGWLVTDMAKAETSFHWEGCPNEEKWSKPMI